ncbi:MAG TPA: GTP cyclohydrolase I FolE [Actinomycetota bacterium]|nr:GTP cyclohydrolase I FolE [Actinomycetota bacterium]
MGELVQVSPSHAPGTVTDEARAVDRRRAEAAVRNLLDALGVDLGAEDVAETPRRVARMYEELLTPRPFNPTTFANEDRYDELVIARDIPFVSLCAHHMLPFHGVAHVGYLPGDRIVGLSKLARVVTYFARSLQVQERLTKQVAEWLDDELRPRGAGVVIRATHQCMTIRGVQAAGSTTVTSAMSGLLRESLSTREEFLALCGERS